MEIEKCGCGHNAIEYHGIQRHFGRMADGKQIYSDGCMEPSCRCERARIINPENQILLEKERARWKEAVAMG